MEKSLRMHATQRKINWYRPMTIKPTWSAVPTVFAAILTSVLFSLIVPAFADTSSSWGGAWYGAPVGYTPQFSDSTVRTVLRAGVGGDRIRIRLSNFYGKSVLRVGAASVTGSAGSRVIKFNGMPNAVVEPGDTVASDSVDLRVSASEEITIAVYYPEPIPQPVTMSHGSAASNLLDSGNAIANAGGTQTVPLLFTYFLTAVDVENAESRSTIVALGDSITAGERSWPSMLQQRLQVEGKKHAVLNAGIGGNRLLNDYYAERMGTQFGESALKRFDHDVLARSGITHLIIYEGINDIGLGSGAGANFSIPPTAAAICEGLSRLATQARRYGVKVYVATITPFEGVRAKGYYSTDKERIRREVNAWIRTSKMVDGYIDFDRALADPARPTRLNPSFDSGDHLHPNAVGQRALSDSIDLRLFER